MRQAQNNPTAARPVYPAQSTAPFMPPQGGAPQPTQTYQPVQPTGASAGDTKVYAAYPARNAGAQPKASQSAGAAVPGATASRPDSWASPTGAQGPSGAGNQPAGNDQAAGGATQRVRRTDRYKSSTTDQDQHLTDV